MIKVVSWSKPLWCWNRFIPIKSEPEEISLCINDKLDGNCIRDINSINVKSLASWRILCRNFDYFYLNEVNKCGLCSRIVRNHQNLFPMRKIKSYCKIMGNAENVRSCGKIQLKIQPLTHNLNAFAKVR